MVEVILNEIASSIANLEDSGKLKKLVKDALLENIPIQRIVEKGLRRGLEEVGGRYESGEYFLSELLYAASLANEVFTLLRPQLERADRTVRGRIVLGTVRGDIHDIGKNVFKMLAEAAGFEVYDLGVDVCPKKFLLKIRETGSPILGLSSLLTTTLTEMKAVITELEKEGIRGHVKVILGGNAVTKEFASEIGADEAALDAVEGLEACKRWART